MSLSLKPIMSLTSPKAPKKFFILIWVHPKNSGLNPWSFQFWGYLRLGLRHKLSPPPKTGGRIRQCSPHPRPPVHVFLPPYLYSL